MVEALVGIAGLTPVNYVIDKSEIGTYQGFPRL
jgi:hypothetical protein